MATPPYSSFTSSEDENVLFRSENPHNTKRSRLPLSIGTFLQRCLLLSFLVVIIFICTVIAAVYAISISRQHNGSRHFNENDIRNSTQFAWASYRQYAWPEGALAPLSKSSAPLPYMAVKSSGYSIFSAMSTLYLMDLKVEFDEGRQWIEQEFDFAQFDGFCSVHDVITNYIGGLLSLFALTRDALFLEKATVVGDVLMKLAFNSKTGFLHEQINPKRQMARDNFDSLMPISQSGFYQPELILLAQLTNNSLLFERLQSIATQALKTPENFYFWKNLETAKEPVQYYMKGAVERPAEDIFHNLLRSYLLSDRRDTAAINLLYSTLSESLAHYLKYKVPNALTYSTSDLIHRTPLNKTLLFEGDCALGALLTVGAAELKRFNGNDRDVIERHHFNKYFKAGVNITKTCYRALQMTPAKVLPVECSVQEGVVRPLNDTDSASLLYFTESIFSLWRQTENARYLDYADAVRRSLLYRKTPGGGIANVRDVTAGVFPEKIDFQEPMLLSGTLKYLYLTYVDESVLPMDQYVFNELGHPLPICGRHPLYPAELCNYGSRSI